jgi:hypothetical protein
MAAAIALQNPRNPYMRIGWLVNENHFRNDIALSKWFSFTMCGFRGFCYAMAVAAAVKKIYIKSTPKMYSGYLIYQGLCSFSTCTT